MQEIKFITINTKSLFEEHTLCKENVEITEKGIRLKRRILKPRIKYPDSSEESIDSLHDSKMNFLDYYTFYIRKKTKTILKSHVALLETPFPEYTPNNGNIGEYPEGILVYKNYDSNKDFFGIIGRFESPQWEGKDDFVALGKNDFDVLNSIGKGWVLLLVENEPFADPNQKKSNFTRKGIYYSIIDSGIEKNLWYRFILEGNFPKGTKVIFQYYISENFDIKEILNNIDKNNCEENKLLDWKKSFSRGSAIQGEERRDALFKEANQGRYLLFKIILYGTEKLSPIISSVMLFSPKVSYLDYLPSVYREDVANSDFLDRFLAIFESLFFEIDFTIDHLSRWLDAAGTPPEFIEWLGGWIGANQIRADNFYETKDDQEAKQREYLSLAVSMYRERGTKAGLEKLISFYTGKTPVIIDNFSFDCTRENTENEYGKKDQNRINESRLSYGEDTDKIKGSSYDTHFRKNNFSFLVLFNEKLEEAEKELIINIIEQEKPAYTKYELIEPWYLDGNAYLGINTKL